MASGWILCVLVTLLHVRSGVGERPKAFGYKSQAAWLDYYTQNKQLTIPDSQRFGSTSYKPSSTDVYQHLSSSHLRLDCNPSPLDLGKIPTNKDWPVTDFPMCDTLLKRVHSALHADQTGHYLHRYVDGDTEWGPVGTTPKMSATSFGDAYGLDYPDVMELPKFFGSLHNDTHCTSQEDSCRQTLRCQMSWVYSAQDWLFGTVPKARLMYGNALPPRGSIDGSGSMASRGTFGGFEDLPLEYCQICAHTACPTEPQSDTATPALCPAGFSQKKKAQAWMKISKKNDICPYACPAGSWMTCPDSSDIDRCVYPPQQDPKIQTEKQWLYKVISLANGITIPTRINNITFLPTPVTDITNCFPCSLAGEYGHYGEVAQGGVHRDANGKPNYADFYCPGANHPPVKCKKGLEGNIVYAGSDMRGANPQTSCQCLAGYYSAKLDKSTLPLNEYVSYKAASGAALDCLPCPAGSYCRFRAELPAPGYIGNTSCPIGQQKCDCPLNFYCPGPLTDGGPGSSEPIPCNAMGCTDKAPALTQCSTGFQTKAPRCVPCNSCEQMGGTAGPCQNMVHLVNTTR
jgi:hypothetical protein